MYMYMQTSKSLPSVWEESVRVTTAVPEMVKLLGPGTVTVCEPPGAEVVTVADCEQPGAKAVRAAVWEKLVAEAVTAAAAW